MAEDRESLVRQAVLSAVGGGATYANFKKLANGASGYSAGDVTEAEAKKAVTQLRRNGQLANNMPIRRHG